MPPPASNDTVTVNYRAPLSTAKSSTVPPRPVPRQVPSKGVIPGWTKALQLMKVGSKWQVFIPSALAYGDMGRPNIEPGSTLVFEVELLRAEPPAPPPARSPAHQ